MPAAGFRKVNSDGSRNIHCSRCFDFICTASAMSGINTALCVVCQCDEEGIELTDAQVADLKAVRIGGQVISHSAAYPDVVADPMTQATGNEVDTQVGRKGFFVKALVRNMRAAVGAILDVIPESKQLAKEKKRKRIFDLPIDVEDKAE
jgi:hypothetical protein